MIEFGHCEHGGVYVLQADNAQCFLILQQRCLCEMSLVASSASVDLGLSLGLLSADFQPALLQWKPYCSFYLLMDS